MLRFMTSLLSVAAFGLLLSCAGAATPQTHHWSGVYSFHFETVAFHPEGSNQQWWVVMETDEARQALQAAIAEAPGQRPWGDAYVTIEGTLSPAGHYGHMAAYDHEVHVTRVINSSPAHD